MQIPILRRRIRLALTYVILFTVMVWTLRWEHIPPGTFSARLNRILRGSYFDFVTWEVEALWDKIGRTVV